jgi:tetratricopeptide (TPR) repeat protein
MTSLSFHYGITGDDLDQKIYGEKVLNFYLTLGKDTSCLHLKVGNKQNLELYGGLFNMLPAAASKIFPGVDAYDMRHLFDSIAGFIAILFAGLLARKLGGWRTGFIALILLATWPQFFGQSMNNPKDIPFAMAYVFTIYYLLKFVTELPRPSTRTITLATVGIALAINMRVGGLLLIGMLFAFIVGNYILSKSLRQSFSADKKAPGRTVKYLLLISVIGYFGGLLFWPYGIMGPFSHPFVALKEITNFSINIRVLFDGKQMFSSLIPWYYIPKWLWVTTPIVIIAGALLLPFLLLLMKKYYNINHLLLIGFATVFPWAYATYKHSALYDGMRQMLFIIPTIAVLAAVTWDYFLLAAKTKAIRYTVAGLLVIGILLPVRFSFANHPNEYVYFNEIYGGTKKAYGNFDTDYYMNSIREDCEWVKKNIKPQNGRKIIIGTNTADPVSWYLGGDTANYETVYVRFNERTKKDYDYGIFYSRPLDRSQLMNNSWLGSHPAYVVKADGIPLSVVTERKDKSDFYAEGAMSKNDFAKADSLFTLAVKHDPLNELAWTRLAMAQLQQQKVKEAISSLQEALKVYPNNSQATSMLGLAYAQSGDAQNGIAYLTQSVQQNPNNPQAYYYLAMIYQQLGDREKAQYYMGIVKQFQGQ